MAQRYCRVCSGWHDVDEPWPQACLEHYKAAKGSLQIVKDIDPYKSVITGEVIGGRRQHREHLKSHGCIEVGNERGKQFQPSYVGGLGQDIKRAMEKQRAG